MTGESPGMSAGKRFTLTQWDQLEEVRKVIDAHGRRVGARRELGELSIRDGTSPEELDEFLEQQRKEDTEE